MVTGNLRHAQQGMGVMVTCGVLPPALVLQKRCRWGEKDTKGAQGSICDGVSGVWPRFAMVRQVSDPSMQDALEGIEASGIGHGDLLGPMEITTLTMSVCLGNREPFACQN
jgi:hypothetical protein